MTLIISTATTGSDHSTIALVSTTARLKTKCLIILSLMVQFCMVIVLTMFFHKISILTKFSTGHFSCEKRLSCIIKGILLIDYIDYNWLCVRPAAPLFAKEICLWKTHTCTISLSRRILDFAQGLIKRN